MTVRGIPRLDLREYERADSAVAFAERLRDALCEFGFVTLEGHGVLDALIRETYAGFERFFALPASQKATLTGTAGGQRGYTPFAIEHAKDSAEPDLKEFFHVGPNGVEPHNVWPVEVPELEKAASALFSELQRCSARLLRALAAGLGLSHDSFASLLEGGHSILRALHYPPVAPDERPDALRAAPHEDINLITLLCEATDSGLEILHRDGRWLPVEAPPGQIVVDAGDMLCRLTGGRVPSTTHRVVRTATAAQRSRYAMPFFAHPAPHSDLSVLGPFRTPESVAAHPAITAGEYLEERLREIGLR